MTCSTKELVRYLFRNDIDTVLSYQSEAAAREEGDGVRYLEQIFSSVATPTSGEYQEGYEFELYQPIGDTDTERACVIFYTGGATLSLDGVAGKCIEFAKMGYVAVAAQYKQTIGTFTPELQKLAVVATYRLVNYIRQNAVEFGVDEDLIFGIGTSAGGLTLAQAGITAHSFNTMPFYEPYFNGADFIDIHDAIKGTATISGSATDTYKNFIETTVPPCPPNLFYNGQEDEIFPYTQSIDVFTEQNDMGIPSKCVIFENSGHSIGEEGTIYDDDDIGIIRNFYNIIHNAYVPNDEVVYIDN